LALTSIRELNVVSDTRALQPVATCRQSPCLHKPAIIIVTSFSLWRHSRGSRLRCSQPATKPAILIMTSFPLWRHSLLSWPRPASQTYERTYGHLTAF